MPRRIPLPGVNIPRRPRVRGHRASHHGACGLWFDVESRGVDFCAVRLHGSPLFAEPVRALGLGVFDPAVCVSDSTPLAEVFHKLLAEHLPAVPIVNSQGWCWPAVVCLLCAAFNRVSCSRQGGGRFPSRRDESPRARPYTVQAGASRWRSAAGPRPETCVLEPRPCSLGVVRCVSLTFVAASRVFLSSRFFTRAPLTARYSTYSIVLRC